MMLAVFQIIADSVPNLRSLNLSDNKLFSTEHFSMLKRFASDLKILDLSRNKVRTISLIHWNDEHFLKNFVKLFVTWFRYQTWIVCSVCKDYCLRSSFWMIIHYVTNSMTKLSIWGNLNFCSEYRLLVIRFGGFNVRDLDFFWSFDRNSRCIKLLNKNLHALRNWWN